MDIKVLGAGCCASCRNTVALIEQVAQANGATVSVEKIEDLQEVLHYGLMSTPGVVIDGKVVHAGGIPNREKITQWLSSALSVATPTPAGRCCGEH
ncbi:MAG TPA: thioredoxin family protein [Casimicrobiaceae bacterium]